MIHEVNIGSRDYWFKIVDFLQQNWALVDLEPDGSAAAHFIGDTSGVFDAIRFASVGAATAALRRNGFRRFAEDPEAEKMLSPPTAPFRKASHPNGLIYSSGRYWK